MISRQGSILSSVSNSHSHPQKIGPWKLGKTLGRGATGRVLLGVHQNTGQKAAVKVVSKSNLADDYDRPKEKKGGLPYGIEREIIIMKLLTHPNVLRLYDVWETSKALYLVLEYVEGGELFDLLVERGPLQEQEAVKYFRQIVLGTAYCHALGICHRDLKPENLLLDAALNVKLADFGMAALEANGKLLETSCGSPHYAAPEIVSGLKYHGAASDIWSCGVILFALLTGRLPFDDENIRNLLLKVQAGNFEMPAELSREAQDLIWRMLTVDPMDRVSTSEVLEHPLLQKYPVPNEDLISVKSLPHPKTAYKSLGRASNIDSQILENLCILWNQRPESEIIAALLAEGPNPEKTFYALLLRYRHTQDASIQSSNSLVGQVPGAEPGTPRKLPRSTSQMSNKLGTPRRKAQISASNPKNRPVSFQRRYGNNASPGRSQYASPYKSPSRSPQKSPRRARQRQSYQNRQSYQGPLPRNIYNEIMAAAPPDGVDSNQSFGSMPPTLPSKDSIYGPDTPATTALEHGKSEERATNHESNEKPGKSEHLEPFREKSDKYEKSERPEKYGGKSGKYAEKPDNSGEKQLFEAATIIPSSPAKKRQSMIKASRIGSRRSLRQSFTSGIKRNSITVKLLSTYAKLSSETDWEYMDKQTKRTSATFGTLCDKIFNHEEYNEDDEKLIDDEEQRAREYERLMELERKKHEAEWKARRELAKQKKRQSRRSLLSSRKLHITVTEDPEGDAKDGAKGAKEGEGKDRDFGNGKAESLWQPKRTHKSTLRALSEGHEPGDELTAADVDAIKQRSATQPAPRRRLTPILTRRPVSRLDPLWVAHENAEMDQAHAELEAEHREYTRQQKMRNRESMVSVGADDDDDVNRLSKDFEYDATNFELPEHQAENYDLSEEYMSEIRKSRLLNSQLNINQNLNRNSVQNRNSIINRNSNSNQNGKRDSVVNKNSIQNVNRNPTNRNSTNRDSIGNRNPTVRHTPRNKDDRKDDRKEERKTLIGSVNIPTVTRRSSQFSASNKRLSILTIKSTKESYRDLNSFLDTHNENVDDDELNEEEQLAGRMPALRTSFADRLDRAGQGAEPADADEDSASVMDFDEHLANKRTSYYAGAPPRRQSKVAPGSAQADPSSTKEEYTFAEDERGATTKEDVFDNIKLPSQSRARATQPPASTMLLPGKTRKSQAAKAAASASGVGAEKGSDKRDASGTQADAANRRDLSGHKSDVSKNGTEKPLADSTNTTKKNKSIFRKLSWGTKKHTEEAESEQGAEPERRGGLFARLFSNPPPQPDVHRYLTILPKQEMMTALYALLNSWASFGLKNLKKDLDGYNLTGSVSSKNSFNLKSCKFRIKISQRDSNQKSEVICAHVKGSSSTSATLFKEIKKVLEKEMVMDQ